LPPYGGLIGAVLITIVFHDLLTITGMNHKASCGVLYPPLCGIVQLANSDTLCFRNWSFTMKTIQELLAMSHVYVNKSWSKTKIIIAVLIVGFVMIVGLLYWQTGNNENTEEMASATQSHASNMSKKEVIDAQELAAVAAISGKTVSGTVTQRPDYVSEIEWQVLQNVTKKQPDNTKKLTNLVNKLLFTKKKRAWLSAGENTDQRRQLARQLLDMMPEQLAIEAIDSETAKEMETKLAADVR
jgi:hypothetical protein